MRDLYEEVKKMRHRWRIYLITVGFILAATLNVLGAEQTFTTIDVSGATRTVARWVNPEGDIVGFYDAGGTTHGFVRSKEAGFATIDFPGAVFTQATSINPEGDIVGGYAGGHGFLLSKNEKEEGKE